MTLAERAGRADAARATACAALLARVQQEGLAQVRVVWADLHGALRGKTLVLPGPALADALADGVGLVSTLLLKDTSDRTALPVFEPGALAALPGFGAANNVLLLPDPQRLFTLPWAPGTAWLMAEPFWPDGTPVLADPRRVLQAALARLAESGYGLRCGLEVEFHAYPLAGAPARADAEGWPAPAPEVHALHPGHGLLMDAWADRAEPVLRVVREVALGLGLPLRSLEVEIGPSQLEAVFGAQDALAAADGLLRLRNGVVQALRRAGFHATFMCKPPLAGAMASGWHLHQSLVDAEGRNAMAPTAPPPGAGAHEAAAWLSEAGVHWLAGQLAHAPALAALAAPTANAYGRYQGSPMAPRAAHWGRDNRGAMVRVLGGPGDPATRLENRLGEPLANPYLCIAAQVLAGLDGLRRRLQPPPATHTPYADGAAPALPQHLGAALDALAGNEVLRAGLGEPMVQVFDAIKRQELARRLAASDAAEWDRRELFARF
jgi:glutamine synthetase